MRLRRNRWFLPDTPDVLGMLRAQAADTIEAMDALVAWAQGDAAKGEVVRELEHRADERKRELQRSLKVAFSTPLEPEDLFALSRGLDAILNGAKDAVREAEVMGLGPDGATAEMATFLAEAVRHLGEAFERLGADGGDATDAADAAIKAQRRLERVYRRAMGALIEIADLREVMARRELYRRLARLGDLVVDVGERVWYAVVKEA